MKKKKVINVEYNQQINGNLILICGKNVDKKTLIKTNMTTYNISIRKSKYFY